MRAAELLLLFVTACADGTLPERSPNDPANAEARETPPLVSTNDAGADVASHVHIHGSPQ